MLGFCAVSFDCAKSTYILRLRDNKKTNQPCPSTSLAERSPPAAEERPEAPLTLQLVPAAAAGTATTTGAPAAVTMLAALTLARVPTTWPAIPSASTRAVEPAVAVVIRHRLAAVQDSREAEAAVPIVETIVAAGDPAAGRAGPAGAEATTGPPTVVSATETAIEAVAGGRKAAGPAIGRGRAPPVVAVEAAAAVVETTTVPAAAVDVVDLRRPKRDTTARRPRQDVAAVVGDILTEVDIITIITDMVMVMVITAVVVVVGVTRPTPPNATSTGRCCASTCGTTRSRRVTIGTVAKRRRRTIWRRRRS